MGDFTRVIYIKVLIMSLLPFLLFLACYGVWFIISYKKRDPRLLRTRAISSVVILLFFVHSELVQFMFDMFNCIDVDGESRLKKDLEVICYRGAHYIWSLFVALPSILVWGLGIPFFALLLIF
jgi:hypothetical protein